METVKNDTNLTKRKLNVKGTFAGLGAGILAQGVVAESANLPIHVVKKISGSLSGDKIELVNSATDKILSNLTNLKEKGVEIIDEKEPFSLINFFGGKMPEKLKEMFDIRYATAKGNNAFFLGGENNIHINKEKFSLPVFHEIGHALNYNNSGFWKKMQTSKILGLQMAGLFALLPLLTKEEKAKEGQELTKGQKFKNGLRKASPVLAFASLVPTIAEEGLASIKGCKLAKQVLDKNLYKKVLTTNATALSTYVLSALSFTAFAIIAKKVKDHFQNKQEQQAKNA